MTIQTQTPENPLTEIESLGYRVECVETPFEHIRRTGCQLFDTLIGEEIMLICYECQKVWRTDLPSTSQMPTEGLMRRAAWLILNH